MEFVQPICDKRKTDGMKKVLAGNKRDMLMFVLGINSGLRISDILEMKVNDVANERKRPLDGYELREKKTGKTRKLPCLRTSRRRSPTT